MSEFARNIHGPQRVNSSGFQFRKLLDGLAVHLGRTFMLTEGIIVIIYNQVKILDCTVNTVYSKSASAILCVKC